MCGTTLWNMRYASLRAVSILISDSSWDRAVTARFSDDSKCHEQEQLDGVTQNPWNTTSRHHSNAEANLEEENMSNLTPPQSTEEFF